MSASVVVRSGPRPSRDVAERKALARKIYETEGLQTSQVARRVERSAALVKQWKQADAKAGKPWTRPETSPILINRNARRKRAVPDTSLYQHEAMPRCAILEPHPRSACGYFADADPVVDRQVVIGGSSQMEKLMWQATCLVKRGLSFEEVGERMDMPAADVKLLVPKAYRT